MGALILGALALLFALLLLRWFVGADPKGLIKGLRFSGASLLLLAAIGLAFLDRPALAMVAASFAWALFTGGRAWPYGWPNVFPSARSRAQRPANSQVETEWLDMLLDHETGEMKGKIRKGEHAGESLESLTRGELSELCREIAGSDSQSERLLEAYLERRFGGNWRADPNEGQRQSDSGMTRAEAYRVLGLESDASEDDVRAAHRRLMLQNHPDKGGSSYLAAKINEAKDVLLAS